jgi:ABC-type nickel/cobalt efflux system permease component RcnA
VVDEASKADDLAARELTGAVAGEGRGPRTRVALRRRERVRTSSTLSLVVVSLEAPRTLSALKNARRPCFCKILSAVIASNTSVYCPFTRYRRQGRRGERGEEGKHAQTPEHTTHEHTHTHTGQQKHAEVSKQVARKTEDGTGKAVVAAALVCPDSHVEAVHRTFYRTQNIRPASSSTSKLWLQPT